MNTENKGLKYYWSEFSAIPESTVIITLFVLTAVSGAFTRNFFAASNIVSILRNLAFFAIIAVGESMCLLLGKIDLSAGMVSGLGAVFSTWAMTSLGLPPILGLILGLVLGGLMGVINGLLVTYGGLVPFIATVGTQYVARGLKLMITNGYPVYPLPSSTIDFGKAEPLGISWAFFIAMALLLVFDFLLRRTTYGRNVYAVGDNPEVAKMSGINPDRLVIISYVISGIMATLAGTLMAFQLQTGQPTIGEGWDLQAVSAIAVGGVSLKGGRGTILGTLLGVLFIAVLQNCLVLFRIPSNVVTMMTGVVLIAAVTVDVVKSRKKTKN